MPKREEVEEVVQTEPKKDTATVSQGVIYTEQQLRGMEDSLEAILAIYGVDPKKVDGRNTAAKFTRLILAAQAEALAKHGKTPDALLSFSPVKDEVATATLATVKPAGTVDVSIGLTKNLGDFNSLKYGVGVTLPLDPTPADLDSARKTIDIARKLVMEKMDEDMETIKRDLA